MSRQTKEILDAAPEPQHSEASMTAMSSAPAHLTVAHDSMDEVLAAGIDLGRLEALDFVLTVGTAAVVSVFENVKKSKGWKFLRNPSSSHGEKFSSLEEFCEVKLGKSYKRLQAISANRNLVGQDAFEQAERLGLRQVDYNAIKGLPAPDQELLRRAVEEAQSRDEVLDLLQELAARHAKEKETLKAELDDARDQAEELAGSKKVVEATVADLRKQARQFAQATPDEQAQDLRGKIQAVTTGIEAEIRGPLCDGLEQLIAHGEEMGQSQRAWVKGQLETILERLQTVAGRAGVELVMGSSKLAWLDANAISGVATEAAH